MEVTKPIIIIGTGRSGTTVFHEMLSKHSNLAWLSGLCERYPDRPEINRFLMKSLDFPVIAKLLQKTIIPRECALFWEHHCKGFLTPCRDLLSTDVTHKNKLHTQYIISKLITKKRNRPLIKITGWPRIGFLSTIFEDVKFIHVLRDGRAVANSLINEGFWWGWRGDENWRWGSLSPDQKQEWERYNRSFVVLAAIQWKILVDAIDRAKKYVSDNNFLEIKYEQLCQDPIALFKKVAEFCQLDWTNDFEKEIARFKLKNTNYKWQQELNDTQQRDLEQVLREYLVKYCYQ
jgi:hypothetical protein